MLSRMEHDSIGVLNVPAEAYYGVQSMRAATNFQITHRPLHPVLIDSIVMVKKAAAITNKKSGKLDQSIAQAIIQACDEILDGNLRDQFIVDAIQGGAGTSANMNANKGQCEEYIEKSVGISTALCPYIGYAKSAEIAKKSLKTGVSVKELVLEEGLLNEEELKEILKPEKMTRPMREKVMKAVSQIQLEYKKE